MRAKEFINRTYSFNNFQVPILENEDLIGSNVAYHKELNPGIWRNETLRPEVRDRLLEIANIFVEYLELNDFNVIDVVLTGSMANYNWTKYSDIDIHVVTDYEDLHADHIAEAFFRAKKHIWNDKHDITIRGHETELYVEDEKTPPVSSGIYSILNNKWLNKPAYEPPDINNRAVNHKVHDLIRRIDAVLQHDDDPEDIEHLTDKIYNMRKAGLASGGEFSVENLSFKILRNLGYITKLFTEHDRLQDKELSLPEHRLTEIDSASALDDTSISHEDIIQNSQIAGKIDGQVVHGYQQGTNLVFFFETNNEIDALVALNYQYLKAIRNYTNKPGRITALFQFIVHNITPELTIGDKEPLTPDGLKWLLSVIKSGGRGLTLTDQNGNTPDYRELQKEWDRSTQNNIHGPTSITISESRNLKKQLAWQESSLMFTISTIGNEFLP